MTFTPEGGSERIRAVINKNITEADLLATVGAAFEAGWGSTSSWPSRGTLGTVRGGNRRTSRPRSHESH